MTYAVEVQGEEITAIYRDDILQPPDGAIEISEQEGELLRCCSDFSSYCYRDGHVIPCAPNKTPEGIKKELVGAVQRLLDEAAAERGYDSIMSACSYAAAPNVFQAESIKFLEWRAAVWATCYGILADVQAGNRTVPSAALLLSALPKLAL